jgi:GntR family transcriptional repressor for pyruvate dehydrogenase complex
MAYNRVKPKERLYQDIVNQIQQRIIQGELNPGDRLPAERELAEDFEVSRTAVREAIKSLAEKDLVEIHVGRGTFVKAPSPDRVAETINVLIQVARGSSDDLQVSRQILEVPIARLAASNRKAEHLERLASLIDTMESSVDSPTEFINADTDFHGELALATGNPVLHVLIQPIISLLRDEQTFSVDYQTAFNTALASHRELYEHIEAQNPEEAAESMRSHLEQVNSMLTPSQDPE